MSQYKISIDQDALFDIQQATDWYNEQLLELGGRFQEQVKTQIDSLRINPAIYSIRYENVRCMLIKKFPFLVHFAINEKQNFVEVFAVFHTSRNPQIWWERKNP